MNSSLPGAGSIGGPVRRLRAGVLALQGDVLEHFAILESAGAQASRVRNQDELNAVDALVIPGGESTTIGLLLERFKLMEPLRKRIEGGMPVLGTCAGAILLASEIEASAQPRIGTMDIAVLRNAFGRQVDSFETELSRPDDPTKPLRGVFIRAPRLTRIGEGVDLLVDSPWGPVAARQNRQIAVTFHPELAGEDYFHRLLLHLACGGEEPG